MKKANRNVDKMAGRRLAFQNNRELQRFVLPRVCATGRELRRGSYGSVEELEVNGLVCAGKRLFEVFLERGNADVENIVHRYQEECQVGLQYSYTGQINFPCYPSTSVPRLFTSPVSDLAFNCHCR